MSTTTKDNASAAPLRQARERVRDLEAQVRAVAQELEELAEADRKELQRLNSRRTTGFRIENLAGGATIQHRGKQLISRDGEPVDLERLKETNPALWRFYKRPELRQLLRRVSQELSAARDTLRSAENVASISLSPQQRATLQGLVDQAAAERALLDAVFAGGNDPSGLFGAAPRKPAALEGLLASAAKLGVYPTNGRRP